MEIRSDESDMISGVGDGVVLVARLFLVALFLIFGWRKMRDYSGTVSQMVRDGVPVPVLATGAAIFMELPVSFAIAAGAFTRLLAVFMALYTLGTSLIEHRYWAMTGENRVAGLESFYKNLSIMGGFLLLHLTGPGEYSIDALCGIGRP
jgi:putative oxidoreductase